MESWLENFARANFQRSADTAHDLKTPLNVAVLNLELLRMRLRKLESAEDERAAECMRAIEIELRRMGQIFDAFFLLSTPPRDEASPERVDAAPLASEAAEAAGFMLELEGAAAVYAHPERLRRMLGLFFEGGPKHLQREASAASASAQDGTFAVSISGPGLTGTTELTKAFKFYYSDREGKPDLSLAVARLVAETYGGTVEAAEENGKVTIRLSLPLGEQ
jgi:signal transduction histidine kinase